MSNYLPRVNVGDTLDSPRLGTCKIVKVLPLGTVEVVTRDGRYFRLSGLYSVHKPPPALVQS